MSSTIKEKAPRRTLRHSYDKITAQYLDMRDKRDALLKALRKSAELLRAEGYIESATQAEAALRAAKCAHEAQS